MLYLAGKVLGDPGLIFRDFIRQGMAVNVVKNTLGFPAARQHDVFFGDPDRFTHRCVIVAEIVKSEIGEIVLFSEVYHCLLYTSPSPRD